MTNMAFAITNEDIENVLRNNWAKVANTDGKTFEAMAEDVFADFGDEDLARIENAALDSGTELDDQTDGAYAEIEKILIERGVLEGQGEQFDQFQQIVLEHYDQGEHCVHSRADIPQCGDTLLQFLLSELSEQEDCDSMDTAINRLDSAIRQLTDLMHEFERQALEGDSSKPHDAQAAPQEEQEFNVEVCRTGYAVREIKVRAVTQKQAEEKALDEAGSYDFNEHASDYSVNSVMSV